MSFPLLPAGAGENLVHLVCCMTSILVAMFSWASVSR